MEIIDTTASLDTETNDVYLTVYAKTHKLNEQSFLGNYEMVRLALIESLFNQVRQRKDEQARETLEEINKLFFCEMMGVTNGSIEIENGKLYGLSKRVKLSKSLKKLVEESKE